jgi:DNA-binding protein H-NS
LKVEELLIELGGGKGRTKKESTPVAARYRNPDNKVQTWSGRGKRPLWLNAAIAAGKTLDDLRI